MSDRTVRDYVRGWVGTYISDSDPVQKSRDQIVDHLMGKVPFSPDRECDDWARRVLKNVLHEPKTTVREILRGELTRAVDEEFASLLLDPCVEAIIETWSYPDAPDTEIPWLLGLLLRSGVRTDLKSGELAPHIELYEEGRLRELLEAEHTAREYIREWVSEHAGTDDEDAIETIVEWICEEIERPDGALTPKAKDKMDQALGASHLDSARTAEEVTIEVLKEHVSDDCAELAGPPAADHILSEHSGLNTWAVGAGDPLPKGLADMYEHVVRREFRIRPDQLLAVKRLCGEAESFAESG